MLSLQRYNSLIFKIHSGLLMKLSFYTTLISRSTNFKETNFIQPFKVMTGVYPSDSA
jgi:hypothetical protein